MSSCRDVMLRVFSPTGFNINFTRFHLVLNQDLQDFEDYRGRLRFSAMVIRRRLLSRCLLHHIRGHSPAIFVTLSRQVIHTIRFAPYRQIFGPIRLLRLHYIGAIAPPSSYFFNASRLYWQPFSIKIHVLFFLNRGCEYA